MRSRDLRRALVGLALGAAVVAAAPGKDSKGGGGADLGLPFGGSANPKRKEPITITSDGLEYDYKANVVTYRGNVLAVQGDVKVKSDVLVVTFANTKGANDTPPSDAPTPPAPADAAPGAPTADEAPGGGKVKVQTVTAIGNVRIDQTPRWATGGRAVFDQSSRTLVLSETPVLHDGPNEVVGERVVVFLDENRSVVEGGKQRVKAVLHPDKGGGLAPENPPAATATATSPAKAGAVPTTAKPAVSEAAQ